MIAAGAVAITVLAGSNLLLAAPSSERLTEMRPFLEGMVIMAWATSDVLVPLDGGDRRVASRDSASAVALSPRLLVARVPDWHVRRVDVSHARSDRAYYSELAPQVRRSCSRGTAWSLTAFGLAHLGVSTATRRQRTRVNEASPP